MEVHGPGHVSGPDPIQPNRTRISRYTENTETPSSVGADKVEISDLARYKALLAKVPDIRFERVEALRAQIEAGTYETDEKLEVVVEKLIEELP
jgi:anti-sigma28 factor (negative regulator of flagellin synthesis)